MTKLKRERKSRSKHLPCFITKILVQEILNKLTQIHSQQEDMVISANIMHYKYTSNVTVNGDPNRLNSKDLYMRETYSLL